MRCAGAVQVAPAQDEPAHGVGCVAADTLRCMAPLKGLQTLLTGLQTLLVNNPGGDGVHGTFWMRLGGPSQLRCLPLHLNLGAGEAMAVARCSEKRQQAVERLEIMRHML